MLVTIPQISTTGTPPHHPRLLAAALWHICTGENISHCMNY